jgi:hypothetical protein
MALMFDDSTSLVLVNAVVPEEVPDFFSNMAPSHSPTVATHPQPIHCAMDFRPELTIPLPLHVRHNLNLSQSATFEEPIEEGTVRTQHIKGVEFVWKESGLCVNLPADEE